MYWLVAYGRKKMSHVHGILRWWSASLTKLIITIIAVIIVIIATVDSINITDSASLAIAIILIGRCIITRLINLTQWSLLTTNIIINCFTIKSTTWLRLGIIKLNRILSQLMKL